MVHLKTSIEHKRKAAMEKKGIKKGIRHTETKEQTGKCKSYLISNCIK